MTGIAVHLSGVQFRLLRWLGQHHSSTESYRASTLTIDLIMSGNKAVAWQGQVEGEIDPIQSKTPGQPVDQAVAGIIANLRAHSGP